MSISGSAAINFLFCKPGTKIIVLNRVPGAVYNELVTITDCSASQLYFVDTEVSPFPLELDSYTYIIAMNENFCRVMKDVCGEDYDIVKPTAEQIMELMTTWSEAVIRENERRPQPNLLPIAQNFQAKVLGKH